MTRSHPFPDSIHTARLIPFMYLIDMTPLMDTLPLWVFLLLHPIGWVLALTSLYLILMTIDTIFLIVKGIKGWART